MVRKVTSGSCAIGLSRVVLSLLAGVFFGIGHGVAAQSGEAAPSAAWGSDHAGKSIPEYMTGGECLFCHRDDIGNTWQPNRHNKAMNLISPDSDSIQALRAAAGLAGIVDEITMEVGYGTQRRFLKPNGRYGQSAILSTIWLPPNGGEPGRVLHGDNPTWDDDLFGVRCAGCHATAVETEYKAYSAFSHDCFVCHGVVPEGHQNKPSLAHLSKESPASVRMKMSICAQCHLRGGRSKSTGLPYPNQFVPGDNLFLDYEADFSDERLSEMNPGDRHIFENVRDVVLRGDEELTCLTCHDIHKRSSRKHRTLKKLHRETYCATCHDNLEDWSSLVHYEVHSEVCGY